MPYSYREDISIADAAIEVTANSLEELFIDSAKALTNTMIDNLDSIKCNKKLKIHVLAPSMEFLLFEFLEKLIILKDAETLLFNKFQLEITEISNKLVLDGKIYGEKINYNKHELSADVKAITLHMFKVEKINNNWKANFILDI